MTRPTILEKISFKFIKCMGNPLSLFVHTLLFGGFFILRYLGLVSNGVLLVLVVAVCLEAIYLLIFVHTIVKKNTKSLMDIQTFVTEIRQEEEEAHRLMVNILHLAHQMKTIQHDLSILKKNGVFKANGNGHKIHHRA